MCSRFKRKEIEVGHVPYLIAYLHNNPRHHGFVEDLDQYQYSSHCDPQYQSWIEEFGVKEFSELSEGPGEGYQGNAGLYYRLIEVVNQMKTQEITKVPSEIWYKLHELLRIKKENQKLLRRQTRYLINFERTLS
jgi:hypothetical protein